jgi:L-seryl-tRNA(Ser) seleniumtransferase
MEVQDGPQAETSRHMQPGAEAQHVAADTAAILARDSDAPDAARLPILRRAINGTGLLLSASLGGAPLAEAAVEAVADVARGYCTLELNLQSGQDEPRAEAVESLLRDLAGAEAALVANTHAAALLLALSACAAGGEVLVARGEIGECDGVGLPDLIRQSGARLVEVGTVNRVSLADYQAAIGPETRAILKLRPEEYRIAGAVTAPALADLAGLARAQGLTLIEDLGGATLAGLILPEGAREPALRASLAGGADIVLCAGDRLLGGPQSGLLVGRQAALDPLRRHPLRAALRADKLALAALEATLRLHRVCPPGAIPALRMLAQSEAQLRDRAERLGAMLPEPVFYRIDASNAYAGGVPLPGRAVSSAAIGLAVEGLDAEELARRLRQHRPAVIGRIEDDLVMLDMLAITDDEVADCARAISAALT